MVKAASAGIADADLVLLVLDVKKGLDANGEIALRQLARERRRAYLVINKIDTAAVERALPLIAAINERFAFAATFIVSALDGNGCSDLLAAVAKELPEGPWLFPEDQLSDLSDRALAAEITREQIFHRLHQELPYSITVETEGWAESPDGKEVRIDQTIYVLRDSQKPILIGRKGQQLKALGEASRLELERILDRRVHLFLFVKVRENWLDDPERYREMGLDFQR
jgi:GTPase